MDVDEDSGLDQVTSVDRGNRVVLQLSVGSQFKMQLYI